MKTSQYLFKILKLQGIILSLLFISSGLIAAEKIQDEWDDVSRIVAIGDIHGDYDNYVDVLREAGLINRRGNWIGDETHLVQVGDIPDRGPDTAKIIAHLQKLEKQAQRAGGLVHVLIGNHEFMNVIGDLRYVHAGEYDALTSRKSSRMRDGYYQQVVQAVTAQNEARLEAGEEPQIIDDAFKANWYEKFPLGYVEHRLSWQPDGKFNDWVSKHNSVIRINGILFMHAGLGPELLALSTQEINEKIRAEILGDIDYANNLGESETGPLWYRGLATNTQSDEAPHVANLLDTYKVETVVVGHTPNLGIITPRFGGQVVITDTGISAYYGSHKASMLIEDGKLFALQEGERIPLPANDAGMIPYFQSQLDLTPENQRLKDHLENLLNPVVEEVTAEEIVDR
jgi:hypothetical protein